MNHCYAKMATSSQREGGRESAPPTPSKSSTEKKPQTADNGVQQLIGCQEEHPTHPQGGSSTLKQEDPQPPHVKEEEEELCTIQEGECLLGREESDLTKFPLTSVSVKTEDHDDKPPESLQLHHSPSEENTGSSSSPQHMTTEADGGHCGGSQADNLLAPLSDSDDTTSHSPEDEDRDDTQEPLSSDTDWEDVQHLIGCQEEHPAQPREVSFIWKQEYLQLAHVKEEEEEFWTTQDGECLQGLEEADLPNLPLTVVSVKTEDKPPEFLRLLCPSDVQRLIGCQEAQPPQLQGRNSTLKQEDPHPTHVKEEEEELWTIQEGECLLGREKADLTKLPLSVKTENHEDKPHASTQIQHSSSEENTGSSRSPQHMTPEADGGHCGGSQADNLLAPLSDSDATTSHSPEDEDRHNTQEPLSSDTNWEGDMRTHTNNKHSKLKCSKKKPGKKRSTCSVCDKSFPCKSNLTQHMRTHTGEKPFVCSVCGQKFSFQSGMIRHMRTHTDEQPFACSVCDKRFSDQSGMVRHMRAHTGEQPFSCSVCCKRFFRKDAMVRHMRTHTGEKPFSCSICDKRFSQKDNVVSHMRTHTAETSFSCSVCGKRFGHKAAMVSHMRTHPEENPFSCPVCAQRFYQKAHVVRHMRMHTGEKHFSCSVCGKRFIRKGDIIRHMRTHTGEKPFGCSVCGQRFTRKLSMASHMRTHTGEKPFGCSVCGERFTRASGMVQHMRTHTGHKPFGCSVCGKRFIRKGDRVRHMSTHTGHKPFSCSVCGKSYSCKKRLTTHMQTHNRE
ncbi:oocyte zinc finger protein XlCOF22-like isoform X2 [Dunckerocampus dactyliophorus]|uniref:oocyte zinc finger protein XlCOF22-like isoform X2 n=1 Tax=Dunckerocampus dactyliophorus TaxID=161453 RepID=UPI002405EE38|nr:oocyte zinc finger protein XlCOF22-like isoform X2 [Dunckerocampus dactyliophorus]